MWAAGSYGPSGISQKPEKVTVVARLCAPETAKEEASGPKDAPGRLSLFESGERRDTPVTKSLG